MKCKLQVVILCILLLTLTFVGETKGSSQEAFEFFQTGQYGQARAALLAIESRTPFDSRILIEIANRENDRVTAESEANRLLSYYRAGRLSTPGALGQVAFAAWYLQRWELANNIFIEASQLENAPSSLFVDWGNLFLEKYNPGEAESIFRDALKAPSSDGPNRWQEAHVFLGLSQSLKGQSKSGATQAFEKAVELAPDDPEIVAYQGFLALREEDWEGTREFAGRGLERTPGFLPLMELNCAVDYFKGDQVEFEACRSSLADINPARGELYEVLGDICVIQRRMEDAVSHYDTAYRLDPTNWSALASKGINLLRLGREEEGISSLEAAYKNDPYNIWTVNTLRLVDSFERFDRFESDHFTVRLRKDESGALRPYVEELLERSLQSLEEEYGHEIEGKIVFEMYPDHADFAVRTLGMPGLGALGATFGKVIAMDSPTARPKGEFHWASTLWHEMAHVVTLSLSRNRVPRWFTEGLSMMEERRGGPGWGDGLSVGFIEAYREGELLPLGELNSGFLRPKSAAQLGISYFQAGWVCEFLEREFGKEKIRQMLIEFGEEKATQEVFESVLGESVETIDERFRNDVDQVLKPLAQRLKLPERWDTFESLEEAYSDNPENYFLNIAMGEALAEDGREDEAIVHLKKAIDIFPEGVGEGSPYPSLAEILAEREGHDELRKVLTEWWSRSPMRTEVVFKLADLLAEVGDQDRALQNLEQALFLDPTNQELHKRLGRLYLEKGNADQAVREFKVLVGLSPVDMAGARFELARALNHAGNTEAARREVLFSLEIAPNYQEAQELLLEIIRQ